MLALNQWGNYEFWDKVGQIMVGNLTKLQKIEVHFDPYTDDVYADHWQTLIPADWEIITRILPYLQSKLTNAPLSDASVHFLFCQVRLSIELVNCGAFKDRIVSGLF
jgi:hypothetical protein